MDKYDGAFQKTKEVSASAKKDKDTNDECVLQLRGGGCGKGIDEDQSSRFIWVLKNVRSIQAETRFEEMMHEVSDCAWDLLAVNETWREEKEEIFKLNSRHTWFGSGGVAGKHGVGVLLNERWVLKKKSSNIS